MKMKKRRAVKATPKKRNEWKKVGQSKAKVLLGEVVRWHGMVCGWHAVRKRAADCHDSSVYTYIFSMTLAHLLQTDYVCVGIILIFATNKNCNDNAAHVTQVSIDNNRWRHWNIAITCIYITSMLCITVYRPYMLYRKLPFEASVKLRLFIFF